jgi:hypothetical protein
MRFERCGGCGGFLPPGVTTCPNCSVAKRDAGILSRVGLAGGILGGGAIAFTLMACYGAPPCADGTYNCYNPPEDAGGDSSVPPFDAGDAQGADAATPDGGGQDAASADAAGDSASGDAAASDGAANDAANDAAGDGSTSDAAGDGASDGGGD